MKRVLIILSFIFLFQISFSQSRISIKGKVVDESMLPLPGVSIIVDEKEVATTDFDGKFQIEISENVKKIDFRFISMEALTVLLKTNCTNLEFILLNDSGCYLGASLKKVNRIRKRKFENRKELHKMAYNKGLFSSESFCGDPQFKVFE